MDCWGIILLITIIAVLIKLAGKYSLGCLIVFIIFGVFFIKACNDMEGEEQERKEYSRQRTEKLLKEMEETRYMRTEDYQKEQWKRSHLRNSDKNEDKNK